jgi:hypothetical protein
MSFTRADLESFARRVEVTTWPDNQTKRVVLHDAAHRTIYPVSPAPGSFLAPPDRAECGPLEDEGPVEPCVGRDVHDGGAV